MRATGKFFHGWVVAAAAFVFMVAVWGAYYSFGVYFKPVSGAFGWSRATTAGAFSTYMILHGFVAIFAGRFTDKYGPRLVTAACVLSLALGYGLMSQISSLWQLYLFYGVIIGVGMSGAYVSPVSVVTRWFEKSRGLVLGFVICGVGIGTVLFPPIATFIITTYSWRAAYLLTAVAILVLGAGSAYFLKRDPRDMGLLPYGATAEKKTEPGAKIEAKAPLRPELSTREALHTPAFWQLFSGYFLCLVCLEMIMVHLVPHATDIGISAATAALFLSLIGVGSIVGRIIGGIMSDRIGSNVNIALWTIVQGIAGLSLLVIREPWMFYTFAAVFGLGYGGWTPSFPALIGELFGMKAHGVIFGIIIFAATIGGAAGSLTAGFVFDITQSYSWAFLAAAVANVLAGLVVLAIRQPQKKAVPKLEAVPGLMGDLEQVTPRKNNSPGSICQPIKISSYRTRHFMECLAMLIDKPLAPGGQIETTGVLFEAGQKNARTGITMSFTIPKGKVSDIARVLTFLQLRFGKLDVNLTAKDGSISEQEYEDKVKEAFQQLGIDVKED